MTLAEWVKLCTAGEAPRPGEVTEFEINGVAVCLANYEGELHALDNWCPHRRGPLGQGWLEGRAVVCPWHSWVFDLQSGIADPPEQARVDVLPVRVEGESVLVDLT